MKKDQLCLKCICFEIFLILFTCPAIIAQQANLDSAIVPKSVSANFSLYKTSLAENLGLYNAPRYSFVAKQSYGTPFCDTDSLIIGSIDYDDNYYDTVPLKYDLVNQEVVTTNFEKNALVTLASEKIREFKINKHHFFWLDNELGGVSAGFYDRLYWGETTIWSKRSKELRLSNNAEDQTGKFKTFDQFYIQIGNAFNLVRDKKQLIEILKDNKNNIKDFINKNRFDFNRDFESTLIKVATYYDQLKN